VHAVGMAIELFFTYQLPKKGLLHCVFAVSPFRFVLLSKHYHELNKDTVQRSDA